MYHSESDAGAKRRAFRIFLGLVMVGFSFYSLFLLLLVVPRLLDSGDAWELIAYGALPALIVAGFFFFGLRMVRQAYLGISKAKREDWEI